jgi:exopolysaccharide production protein ExoZ
MGIPLGFAALAATGFLHIMPGDGALEFLTGQENLQRVFVYGLPSALIVYGFMQVKAREGVWTHLGDASYSIYLFHEFAIAPLLTLWLVFPIQPDLIIIIGMIAAVLLSWRIHVLVELPILRAIPTTIAGTRVKADLAEVR